MNLLRIKWTNIRNTVRQLWSLIKHFGSVVCSCQRVWFLHSWCSCCGMRSTTPSLVTCKTPRRCAAVLSAACPSCMERHSTRWLSCCPGSHGGHITLATGWAVYTWWWLSALLMACSPLCCWHNAHCLQRSPATIRTDSDSCSTVRYQCRPFSCPEGQCPDLSSRLCSIPGSLSYWLLQHPLLWCSVWKHGGLCSFSGLLGAGGGAELRLHALHGLLQPKPLR